MTAPPHMPLGRLAAAVLAALAVLAAGCGTDAEGPGFSGQPPVVSTAVPPSTTGVVDVSGTQLTAGLVA